MLWFLQKLESYNSSETNKYDFLLVLCLVSGFGDNVEKNFFN